MAELDHAWVEKPPAGKSEAGAGSGGEALRSSDWLDLDQFKSWLANCCDAVGRPSAIIDLKGNVLAAARWQQAWSMS